MPTALDQLLEHIEKCHADLRAAVAEVDPALRQATPPGGGWSVAQIIQHIALTDRRFGALFKQAFAQLQGHAADELDVDALMQSRKLRAILDRSFKVEAVEAVLPTEDWDAEHAWQMLEQGRAPLMQLIKSAEGLPLGAKSHPHRVLGELNLYEWVAFLGSHEARHAAQIREIAVALGCTPAT